MLQAEPGSPPLGTPDYANSPLLEHTGGLLRPGGLELTARLAALGGLAPGMRVLDIACGTGASIDYLRRQKGIEACGLDVSAVLLRRAKSNGADALVQGGATALPCKPASLDAVLCECAMTLFPTPERVLQQIHSVLRPTGRMLLSDIYARAPREVPTEEPALRCCVDGARTKEDLEKLFAANGFIVENFEDHSGSLKQLAAELVFAHGSLAAFWSALLPGELACQAARNGARFRLGYCLLVAKKR